MHVLRHSFLIAWIWFAAGLGMLRAASAATPETTPYPAQNLAPFVETNFPFFSSVLEGRKFGPNWPTNNLTPRGIVLQLDNDVWACFDTDLLRVAALWQGSTSGVTAVSMSQISYHKPGAKVQEGEKILPEPIGTPWIANGIYPGWQWGANPVFTDPRPPTPDPRQVGRGPLLPSQGRFKAVRQTSQGVILEYLIGSTRVQERLRATTSLGHVVVQRLIHLDSVPAPLTLLLGSAPANATARVECTLGSNAYPNEQSPAELSQNAEGVRYATLRASASPVDLVVAFSRGSIQQPGSFSLPTPVASKPSPPARRWSGDVVTHGERSQRNDAYVVDNIPLPLDNPWKRGVRLADLTFLGPGRAAAVTFDGDVWLISGLGNDLAEVHWQRFASGLHEPLSLCSRAGELFVFDRNGVWRLVDTDGNGEADVHELFSNAFTQGAETREYAHSIRPAPDGSFIIAKGGIQMVAQGTHNGSILRVAPDGASVEVLGSGLRSPFAGVHPITGMITASDQQGHYVPTTPLHVIEGGHFHGFLSTLLPKETYPAPITEPLVWIPYPVNPSGAGQVWLTGARMGPLTDTLVHIGYYRPELFGVSLQRRTPRLQASVVSITRDLAFAPLNGAVNPGDGQLYVTGLQIWGSAAKQGSGLARVRYTGAPSLLPREVVPMDQGVLISFDIPLDPKQATNPANYSLERWNLKRTANYGSPHFKPDGTKGQELVLASRAYLSRDARRVFLSVAGMKTTHQLRVGWSLKTQAGISFEQNAYGSPFELAHFEPRAEGFDLDHVDVAIAPVVAARIEAPASLEEGRRLAELMGCAACHSSDGTLLGKVGPSWKSLFQGKVPLANGQSVLADEAYLRESILDPGAKIVAGYDKSETAMPSYEGLLSAPQVESLILYLKSLK